MGIFDFLRGKKEKQAEIPVDNSVLLEKVEIVPGFSIPRAFVDLWKDIEKTKVPSVRIVATPDGNLSLKQSKFGGLPYMPLSSDYPIDVEGDPMALLAQINFSEVPKLEGYPESGYLQFFISATDDAYGLDFDNRQSQKNFRVLFFEEKDIQQAKQDFKIPDHSLSDTFLPFSGSYRLAFNVHDEYVGLNDVRQDSRYFDLDKILAKHSSIEDELGEEAFETFSHDGHKIGGYAYFTQTDPRIDEVEFEDYILLLQIDSKDEIMWGDCGVANLFIHPTDLARKDFSKVMYTWDCC